MIMIVLKSPRRYGQNDSSYELPSTFDEGYVVDYGKECLDGGGDEEQNDR